MTQFTHPLATLSLLGLLCAPGYSLAQQPPQGLPAEVVTLKTQPLEHSLEAVGNLSANESASISPEQTGRISQIHFQEGKTVSQGEKLFTLEASTYQAELRQVEASRDLSKVEYQQAENLLNRKLGSKHSRDKALAQLQIDEARVNLARTRVNKMTLNAPFSGQLGLRDISVGDYVQAGDALIELVDINTLKADFRIPEIYLSQVSVDQQVEITVDAFAGEVFTGKIYALSPLLDEKGRSLRLRARINNTDGRLRPGLFARVRLVLSRNEQALMAPEQAVIPQGSQFFIYKVVDNKVEMVPVSLGQRQHGKVEILTGLAAGDMIVTAGQMKLRPGSPLTPIFVDQQTSDQSKH